MYQGINRTSLCTDWVSGRNNTGRLSLINTYEKGGKRWGGGLGVTRADLPRLMKFRSVLMQTPSVPSTEIGHCLYPAVMPDSYSRQAA